MFLQKIQIHVYRQLSNATKSGPSSDAANGVVHDRLDDFASIHRVTFPFIHSKQPRPQETAIPSKPWSIPPEEI